MIYIKHRVNKIEELKLCKDRDLGFEIDLRSDVHTNGTIHLSHDPWNKGDLLEVWLKTYKDLNFTGTIIFNTKEDLLEDKVIELCSVFGLSNFFFLDTTIPTTVKLSKRGFTKIASRYSIYEPHSLCEKFIQKTDWLWIDCFGGVPLPNEKELLGLKKNFKLCMVSPELHGFQLAIDVKWKFLAQFCDAICTKQPEVWKNDLISQNFKKE